MQTSLRKMGNSTGMILPKAILDQLGLSSGAKVDVRVEDGKVVAEPVKHKVREGWEEDAKRLGAIGSTEEERDWLETDDTLEDAGEIPEEWLRGEEDEA